MTQTYPPPPPPATIEYKPPGAAAPRGPRGELPRIVWPLLALALLLAFNLAFTPEFFRIRLQDGRLYGVLIDILNRGAPVMILSLGMTLVIATGGIDLSVGAVMAVAGAVAACLISRPATSPLTALPDLGGSLPVVLAVALLVALAAGLWNGLLVTLLDVQPIVATLILMVAGRGVAQLVTDGQVVDVNRPAFSFLGGGAVLTLPFPVLLAAAMTAVTALLTRGTALGLFVESVGNNPRAARLAGVPGGLVRLLAYAFAGVCAGIAGLVVTADVRSADASVTGLDLELDAILAVSLGGTALTGGRFSVVGSVVGAVLLQAVTSTILARGVPRPMTLVIKGCIVVLVCLLQSPQFRQRVRGLTGRGGGR